MIIEKIDILLNEFVNAWNIVTNKRKFVVMAANKSHAESQGEAQLKKGETIKKVEMPRK